MDGKILATCENMIASFDQHMADTYDVPSALFEIIKRCEAAERTAAELRAQLAAVTAQYNTLQEMYRSDHDQRIRLEELLKQITQERDVLSMMIDSREMPIDEVEP